MFRGEADRRGSAGRWHPLIASSESYVTRIMCGLALSLAVAVLAANLPLGEASESVGWYLSHSDERLHIQDLAAPASTSSSALPTRFDGDDQGSKSQTAVVEHEPAAASGAGDSGPPSANLRRFAGRKVLDVAQQMPQIVGGMGAYYIHIDYPEAAVRAGIEGRLVLSFIVDTDGATHQIEIIKSLHPECDSAAVQALRRTRFVPGLQNGEPVQVKMHLPVRFQLVPQAAAEKHASIEG